MTLPRRSTLVSLCSKVHFAKHDQLASLVVAAMDETTGRWEACIVGDDPYAVGAVAATFLQHAEPQLESGDARRSTERTARGAATAAPYHFRAALSSHFFLARR